MQKGTRENPELRWWRETGEEELNQVLLWRWDPIGVADSFPYTANEYSTYAPQLWTILRGGTGRDDLAWRLREMEKDGWGEVYSSEEHLRDVAALLIDWYANSIARWSEFGPPHWR